MPILKLLQDSPFGPREIDIMERAYKEAIRIAGITDRTSPDAESLARAVIASFKYGETDPRVIAEQVAGSREKKFG